MSVELLVDQVERTIEVLSGVLGIEVIERRPSTDVAGEVALLQAGDVVITLFAPAAEGPGRILADRTPRLSQLVFSAPGEELAAMHDRAVESGLATEPLGGGFFVTPESGEGFLGQPTALVVIDEPDGAGA